MAAGPIIWMCGHETAKAFVCGVRRAPMPRGLWRGTGGRWRRSTSRTRITCSGGPYGSLAERLENLLRSAPDSQRWVLRGKPRRMFVEWGRDHVHTLKAMKYFEADVTSGLDYWLETQEANGMVWDCIAENPNGTAPSWFGARSAWTAGISRTLTIARATTGVSTPATRNFFSTETTPAFTRSTGCWPKCRNTRATASGPKRCAPQPAACASAPTRSSFSIRSTGA